VMGRIRGERVSAGPCKGGETPVQLFKKGGGGFLQVAPSETSTFQWYLLKTRMADDGIKDLHVIVVASFSVSIFRGSVEIESPQ
jgi:hypothetical protein